MVAQLRLLSGERFATAITETCGRVCLRSVAGRAGASDAQVCAADGTERCACLTCRAAVAATPGKRRDVATGLLRDVRFDDLPSVFCDLVLPVCAERGQSEQ